MKDGWRAGVDERLIARLEAHARSGERFVRDWSLPSRIRPPALHLDPADWGAGYLRADREREIPIELTNDLHETMPQALLRDLYRPVHEERWVERQPVEGTADRGGFAAMQAVREARRPPPLPRIEPAGRAVREYQAWRRALLAERWQPITKS